jgi:CubicO group peptidase (beta-lactamase class C family)
MEIGGSCDAGFEPVRDAFAANFAERDEVGAAVAVSVDGRVVVDLWGGAADGAGTRAWGPDTLVNAFSVGKALAATCVLRLAERGALDLDRPVAAVWPEFAAAGKEVVTPRHVLTHQAGLPAVREPLPDDAMLDPPTMTAALAAQAPWWTPGTGHGYHVNTFGFLTGEIVRRVTGSTLGAMLAEEVAGPLGADLHLGLAEEHDARTAEFLWPQVARPSPPTDEQLATLTDQQLMGYLAYSNPLGISGAGVVNTRAWRAAEIPSTNMHASARGVERFYRALAAGGATDGVQILDGATLAEATTEQSAGDDLLLGRPSRFGLGFQLTQPERPLGPDPGAFGHFGAGGSLGFCDPEAGLAFGYVMNQLGARWQNPRNRALLDALYSCL